MITLDQGGCDIGARFVLAPPPDLGDLVELISIEDRTRPPHATDAAWRIVPDPAGHLLYQRFARPTGIASRLRVVGARSRFIDIDLGARLRTVAVRLRPGALAVLLGPGEPQWLDRSECLHAAAGSRVAAFQARIDAASSVAAVSDQMMALVRWLARHAEPIDWRVRDAARLLSGSCVYSVDTLATTLGVAPRTLRRVVTDQLGIGPKRWMSIQRMHVALDRFLYDGDSWASAAHYAGFADQAHLIRSSNELLGETPESYVSRGRFRAESRAAATSASRPKSSITSGS